jgi:hypothetical protein
MERSIPAEWLRDGAIPVAQEFCNYLRPLVGELDRHIAELPAAEMKERPESVTSAAKAAV